MTAPRAHAMLQRKLNSLAVYLDELEAVVPATATEYQANPTVRRAVERLVQVVIECATDAADLLLTVEGRTAGDTTRQIFEELHTAGVIDGALRQRFVYEYTGVRNRIVHDYDVLDNDAVWQAARQLVPDGRALLAALLSRMGSGTPPP
jgi:uncharacterized protein YutE (UPF0331/DUF86 family)